MKKVQILLVIAAVAACNLANAQTVALGDMTLAGLKKSRAVVDGVQTTLTWAWNEASAGTSVEITLEKSYDGQFYSIHNLGENDRNPATGRLEWIPRALKEGSETYRIRIDWKIPLINQVLKTAYTPAFSIICPVKRAITLNPPVVVSEPLINGLPFVQFKWTSVGLPAGAKITISATPKDNPEGGTFVFCRTSNTGGYEWWSGQGDVLSGNIIAPNVYNVTAYYENEYGAYSAASNSETLTVLP